MQKWIVQLKSNPKNLAGIVFFLILLGVALGMNWQSVSTLFSWTSDDLQATLEKSEEKVLALKNEREILNDRLNHLLSRRSSFIIIQESELNQLTSSLQDAVRIIAKKGSFNIDRLGSCSYTQIGEGISLARISFSGSCEWGILLKFLAEVEKGTPVFNWGRLDLSISRNNPNLLNVNGELRVVVVQKGDLVRYLSVTNEESVLDILAKEMKELIAAEEAQREKALADSAKAADSANADSEKVADSANADSEKVADSANADSEKVADSANADSEKVADSVNADSEKAADSANADSEKVADSASADSEKAADSASNIDPAKQGDLRE